MYNKYIKALIVNGPLKNTETLIPRIDFITEDTMPFAYKRRQFPLRVCYAMTINKAQGQSLKRVGIDLRTPVFSHGQLYVALSRATDSSNIFVLNPTQENSDQMLNDWVLNVVYFDVFKDI